MTYTLNAPDNGDLPPDGSHVLILRLLQFIGKIAESVWNALTKGESLPEGLTPELLREIEKELLESQVEFRNIAVQRIRADTRRRIAEVTHVLLKIWEFLKGHKREIEAKGMMTDMHMQEGILRNIADRHGLPESTYRWLITKSLPASLQNLA